MSACLLALGAPVLASPVDACRAARHGGPQEARVLCERALAAAEDVEDRFELRLHLSELAMDAADWEQAQALLGSAEADLVHMADPLAGHRLARRRGMLAFRQGDSAQALAQFLAALVAAQEVRDIGAEAISRNDLGLVFRRLGEDREALRQWLASLELRQRSGSGDLAALSANIGTLYIALGELRLAREFIDAAIDGHQRNDRPLLAAHSRESLALIEEAGGDRGAALALLAGVWDVFEAAGAVRDQRRVALHTARLALAEGQTQTAGEWLQRARALFGSAPLPLELDVLEARRLRAVDDADAALQLLQARQPWPPEETATARLDAWHELADSAEHDGRPRLALDALRQAQVLAATIASERHSEQMNALRVRFELASLQREHADLQHRNSLQELALESRRRQLLLLGLLAVVLLAATALWFQRRLYRQRMALQAREADQRARAERATRDADALRADLRSVQAALDRSSDALLVVDAGTRIRSLNQAAAQRLGAPAGELLGQPLQQVFGASAAQRLIAAQDALAEGDADPGSAPIEVEHPSGALQIRVLSLSLEEEFGVLALEAAAEAGGWLQQLGSDAMGERRPATESSPDFRQQLVELMRAGLELWERCTRSGRVELAERSGVWRVTVDDGRLRTRTLDRYLSLDTLPAHPRWREVVRTAYFVLAECALDPPLRLQLEQQLQAVLDGAAQR